jgi:hypothetical protein
MGWESTNREVSLQPAQRPAIMKVRLNLSRHCDPDLGP